KISVGPPFFNLTFAPLMVPLLIAVPFGPLLAWKRGDLAAAAQRLWAAFGVALAAVLITAWASGTERILAALGVGLAAWVIAGALAELLSRARFRSVGIATGLRRLAGLPGSAWGTTLGHMGLGITVLGIVAATAFQVEVIRTVRPGEVVTVAGYDLAFTGIEPRRGPNFVEDVGLFSVRRAGVEVAQLQPTKRIYTARRMPTTESA